MHRAPQNATASTPSRDRTLTAFDTQSSALFPACSVSAVPKIRWLRCQPRMRCDDAQSKGVGPNGGDRARVALGQRHGMVCCNAPAPRVMHGILAATGHDWPTTCMPSMLYPSARAPLPAVTNSCNLVLVRRESECGIAAFAIHR